MGTTTFPLIKMHAARWFRIQRRALAADWLNPKSPLRVHFDSTERQWGPLKTYRFILDFLLHVILIFGVGTYSRGLIHAVLQYTVTLLGYYSSISDCPDNNLSLGSNKCAMRIQHKTVVPPSFQTYIDWSKGDNYLDWWGAEAGQGEPTNTGSDISNLFANTIDME